jgi:phosphoribosylaminoimidazole-succinocarboxamide synthase
MESKGQSYKEKIRANLKNTLDSGFVPALGEHKKGKVRDVHFPIATGPHTDELIMVASDRVSCFDHVLSRRIPFKGAILNKFNEWAMLQTGDIVPNAMLPSPDPNVIIQRKLNNIGFECVVRGYVWGSLAGDYEKGIREKCGNSLPEGLLRYQKLGEPLFTPTTKAEKGHDEDISIEQMREKMKELADKIRDTSIALFRRAEEIAAARGLLFLDTKYEFGINSNDLYARQPYLIDESNTPDSSRYCSKEEYDSKWPKIEEGMKSGKYKNVSELLKANPELKIKEESKQFVRDVLIERGYKEGQPIPELSDEDVVETSLRYIDTYEKVTGKTFDFVESELLPKQRILNNLIKAGYLKYPGCIVPIGASEKDAAHWEKMKEALNENGLPFMNVVYMSAHKQTREVLDYVKQMDETSIQPLVYITFAGRSNGLGPVVAGNTKYPVITCPIFSDIATYNVDIHSSLRMPGNLPLATIVDPGNAVLMAKRILEMGKVE